MRIAARLSTPPFVHRSSVYLLITPLPAAASGAWLAAAYGSTITDPCGGKPRRIRGFEKGAGTKCRDDPSQPVVAAFTSSVETTISSDSFNIPQRPRPDNSTTSVPPAPPMRSPDVCLTSRAWWRDGSVSHRNNGSCRIPDTFAGEPSARQFSRTRRTPGASAV